MSDSYDGVRAPGAELVAWYVDHPSSKAAGATLYISVARNLGEDADVGDCEAGDLTPSQCPPWVLRQRAAGRWPSIYCGLYNWSAVRNAFLAQHVQEPPYWVAHYDGDPTPIPGAIAKQYANPPGSGGNWDLSSVADFWPGIDSGGHPVKLNAPIVGGASTPDGQGYYLVGADGGVFPFGSAKGHGSAGGQHLNAPCVGISVTPSGGGYWLYMADGGVFPYGDATGHGALA